MSKSCSVEQALAAEGMLVLTTVGISMRPMLRSRRDSVVLVPKTERLRENDVALFRRGGDYVLHRVIRVLDTGYLIRGDNCRSAETVAEERVIGVMTAFYRARRYVTLTGPRYRCYVALIRMLHPLVWLLAVLRAPAAAVYHRIKGK